MLLLLLIDMKRRERKKVPVGKYLRSMGTHCKYGQGSRILNGSRILFYIVPVEQLQAKMGGETAEGVYRPGMIRCQDEKIREEGGRGGGWGEKTTTTTTATIHSIVL